MNEKKRKLILVSVTFVLCITIMLSGTFAWSSISQTALNETMGEMTNPGGRLHDDFNGSNKDIYVENFTDIENGMPIIVRIRLFEYMETGENAGNKSARDGVTVLTEGAKIDDPMTWALYDPDSSDSNNHYGYWNWKMGGKTVYMPTFNKDKDSLESDRNGTYEGKDDTAVPFDDYIPYKLGDVVGTHEAKETIDGTVISMAYWLTEGNKELGNYWVYDGDGWAYWANPLWPKEATGLLLSEIGHSKTIADKWYYGIYVECQMVTADEVGSAENQIGFYGEDAKVKPSGSARELLDKIIAAAEYEEAIPAGTYGLLRTDETEKERLMILEEEAATELEEAEENLTESDETEEDKEDTTKGENTEEDKNAEDSDDSDTLEDDLASGGTTDNEPADGDVNDNELTIGDETGETTAGTGENDTASGNDTGDATSTEDSTKTDTEPPITEPEKTVTQKTVEDTTMEPEPVN